MIPYDLRRKYVKMMFPNLMTYDPNISFDDELTEFLETLDTKLEKDIVPETPTPIAPKIAQSPYQTVGLGCAIDFQTREDAVAKCKELAKTLGGVFKVYYGSVEYFVASGSDWYWV